MYLTLKTFIKKDIIQGYMLDLYLQMYDVSYFEARGRHKPLGLYGGGEVDLI